MLNNSPANKWKFFGPVRFILDEDLLSSWIVSIKFDWKQGFGKFESSLFYSTKLTILKCYDPHSLTTEAVLLLLWHLAVYQ